VGSGRVIVVGDIVTDVLAVHIGQLAVGTDTTAAVTFTGGGAAANTAAWLARLGVPVTLVAVVGDDAAGASRLAELTGAGVDCAVRVAPGARTGTVVVLSDGLERTMLNDRGANLLLSTVDVAAALEDAADAVHLHVSGYVFFGPARDAGRTALRTAGLTTSVDAASAGPLRQVGGQNFLSWVRRADLLFANEDEYAALGGAPEGHLVVKRGASGASWLTPGAAPVSAAAPAVKVVDVTGAGDAFAAGLLAAWLDGASPGEALVSGNRAGALAVASLGARPAA
jgi:sugar/nucleoside kinase (ribokinase family)